MSTLLPERQGGQDTVVGRWKIVWTGLANELVDGFEIGAVCTVKQVEKNSFGTRYERACLFQEVFSNAVIVYTSATGCIDRDVNCVATFAQRACRLVDTNVCFHSAQHNGAGRVGSPIGARCSFIERREKVLVAASIKLYFGDWYGTWMQLLDGLGHGGDRGPEALWILFSDDEGQAEYARARNESNDIVYSHAAAFVWHGVDKAFLNVHDDEERGGTIEP